MNEEQPEKIMLKKDVTDDYLAWLVSNNYAINTLKNYHKYIIKMLGIGNPWINSKRIIAFLSHSTNIVKQSAVKSFLIYLDTMHDIEIIVKSYPKIKKVKKLIKPLTKEELDILIKNMPEDYRFLTVLDYIGGLRISEAIKLRVEWFDWEKWFNDKTKYGDLIVKETKRNKERLVPIRPSIMQEIFDFADKREDGSLKAGLLFDFNYKKYIRRQKRKGCDDKVAHYRYYYKVYDYYKKLIRITSIKVLGRPIRSHQIRKFRATELDDNDVPVTKIRDFLGHDNLSTTNTYIEENSAKLKAEFEEKGL